MLVALKVIDYQPGGLKKRFRTWCRKTGEVTSEFVPVANTRFLLITAEKDSKERVDWGKIRRLALGEAGRMLFGVDVYPPPNSGIIPYQGNALMRAIMLTSAMTVLQKLPATNGQRIVGIYDPEARMPEIVEKIIPLVADVRVVTHCPSGYHTAEDKIMQQYGATLTVTDRAEVMAPCILVLAPFGTEKLTNLGRGICFSGKPEVRRKVVGGYIPNVPPQIIKINPAGCDVWHFVSGLYELSGYYEIADTPPLMLSINGKNVTLQEVCWRLAGIDIGISV